MNQNHNHVILAVIQARMDSSRLPGKILEDISGKPLLWHIYDRLKNSKYISKIVIATTDLDSDIPLRDYAKSVGIEYYAGSENDILDRLYFTGQKFESTLLVKITGDCPLIDIKIVDDTIQKFLDSKVEPDLVSNSFIKTFPDGLDCDVINFKTIINLWSELKNPFWREFFIMFIAENKNRFLTINHPNPINLSDLRWTVDYSEDLEFVRKIYSELYQNCKYFEMNDILDLLKNKPEIIKINSKYIANTGQTIFEKSKKMNQNNQI